MSRLAAFNVNARLGVLKPVVSSWLLSAAFGAGRLRLVGASFLRSKAHAAQERLSQKWDQFSSHFGVDHV